MRGIQEEDVTTSVFYVVLMANWIPSTGTSLETDTQKNT